LGAKEAAAPPVLLPAGAALMAGAMAAEASAALTELVAAARLTYAKAAMHYQTAFS